MNDTFTSRNVPAGADISPNCHLCSSQQNTVELSASDQCWCRLQFQASIQHPENCSVFILDLLALWIYWKMGITAKVRVKKRFTPITLPCIDRLNHALTLNTNPTITLSLSLTLPLTLTLIWNLNLKWP